jgi:hypothetical protein
MPASLDNSTGRIEQPVARQTRFASASLGALSEPTDAETDRECFIGGW